MSVVPKGADCAKASHASNLFNCGTCHYDNGLNDNVAVTSPDEISVIFDLTNPVVGDYQLCLAQGADATFKHIHSETNEATISVVAAPNDSYKPGIASNQRVSLMAGMHNSMQLAAKNMPAGAIADQVAFTGGKCSEAFDFIPKESNNTPALAIDKLASFPNKNHNSACVEDGKKAVFVLRLNGKFALPTASAQNVVHKDVSKTVGTTLTDGIITVVDNTGAAVTGAVAVTTLEESDVGEDVYEVQITVVPPATRTKMYLKINADALCPSDQICTNDPSAAYAANCTSGWWTTNNAKDSPWKPSGCVAATSLENIIEFDVGG